MWIRPLRRLPDGDSMTASKAPSGLGHRGKGFWLEITQAYQLSGPERELLLEVCRTLDVVEALSDRTDRASLAEARQQRLVLGRLLAQLEIPDSDVTEPPIRRRARQAAEKRWAAPVTKREGT